MDDGQFYSSLGVVWVFGFVLVMLIAWHLRSKRQLEKLKIIHEERMKAMEQGIPLPEFPELKEDERSSARRSPPTSRPGPGTRAGRWASERCSSRAVWAPWSP